MAKDRVSLLPPAEKLALLSDPTALATVESVDNANRREHSYAVLAMVCGTIGLLGCVGAYVYLVETGHPEAGGVVLGTGVLTIIGQIVNSRLNAKS